MTKRLLFFIIGILLIVFAGTNISWADETSLSVPSLSVSSNIGIITGQVISGLTNLPIEGARVSINNTIIYTDVKGDFTFTQADPGIYTVYYEASGYEAQTQQYIAVYDGMTTTTPTATMSSNTGEIYGKVISAATGGAISGTAVRIDNVVIPTSANGEFRFTLIHPGVYTVYYDAPGHLPQLQEFITVHPNQQVTPPVVVLSANGPPNIKIDISENRLYLYYGTYLVRVYPIATGMRSYPTPIRTYKIIRKDINPTWYPPKWADVKEPVRPGPKNPLGTRRLLLSDPSYGIHGTNQLWSIGKRVTHGCIRLYPWEIVDLYDRVIVGTVVDIVP